jgi:hypothetical protein
MSMTSPLQTVLLSCLKNPQYIAKKEADEVSYIWDELIQAFSRSLLDGTNIVPPGMPTGISEIEEGVREMVTVPRHIRRMYGNGIIDAMMIGKSKTRMTRTFLPVPSDPNQDIAFFFMTLAVPPASVSGGYERYREGRVKFVQTYAYALLHKFPLLKRVVGIASEPPRGPGNPGGHSQDLIVADRPQWTLESIADLEHDKALLGIMQDPKAPIYRVHGSEYPDVPPRGN